MTPPDLAVNASTVQAGCQSVFHPASPGRPMMRSRSRRDAQPPRHFVPSIRGSRPMTAEVAPGCSVDAAFDPLSPAYLDDPYAILAALPLAEAPIFYAPSIGYHVVTRYADIAQVFDDPATYSAAVAQAPLVPLSPEAQRILLDGGHAPQPSMVSLDEPAHARLRKPA